MESALSFICHLCGCYSNCCMGKYYLIVIVFNVLNIFSSISLCCIFPFFFALFLFYSFLPFVSFFPFFFQHAYCLLLSCIHCLAIIFTSCLLVWIYLSILQEACSSYPSVPWTSSSYTERSSVMTVSWLSVFPTACRSSWKNGKQPADQSIFLHSTSKSSI